MVDEKKAVVTLDDVCHAWHKAATMAYLAHYYGGDLGDTIDAYHEASALDWQYRLANSE